MHRLPTYAQIKEWLMAVLGKYHQMRLEFVTSFSLSLLGLWLVYTGLNNVPPLAYGFLATLAPLHVWGFLFLLIGLFGRWAIYHQRTRCQKIALLANLFCRLFLLAAVAYGTDFTSNTIPEHVSWLIVTLWAYLAASGG